MCKLLQKHQPQKPIIHNHALLTPSQCGTRMNSATLVAAVLAVEVAAGP